MTIRASTIRNISLSQPAGPTPDAIPAIERQTVVPSAIRDQQDATGQLIGKSLSALGEFAQAVDERKDEIEIVRFGTQLEQETAGLPQQALSEVEPNRAPQRYLELHKQTTERLLEQTDDPDVKLALQQASSKQRAGQFSLLVRQVDIEQRRMLFNEYDARKQLKIRQAAEAENPEQRDALINEVRQINQRIAESNAIAPSGEQWTDTELELANREAAEIVNDARATKLISEERFAEAEQVIENEVLDPKTRAARRSNLETARKKMGREAMDTLSDHFALFVATDGREGHAGINAASNRVAEFGTNDQQKDALAMVEAAQEAETLLDKPLPDQAKRLRTLRDQATKPEDVIKLRALAKMSQQQAQMYSERPLDTAARASGMRLNEMPEEQTPENFREFFAQREEFAAIAEEKQGLAPGSVSPLETTEMAGLKQTLTNIGEDPMSGITLLSSARRNLDPRRYSAMASQLGADAPALAGGVFVAGTGDFALASQIWQGRKIMESDASFNIPEKSVRSGTVGSVIGDSFEAMEHPNVLAAIEQAALAHAHANADMETREITPSDLEASTEAVLGKMVSSGGLVGDGITEINGYKTPNPIRGANEAFVLNAWENVAKADLINYAIDGIVGPPMMNRGDGQPVELPEEALESVRVRARDMVAGTYELQGTDGLPLQDRNGNPYVVNLRDMLLETGSGTADFGTLTLDPQEGRAF